MPRAYIGLGSNLGDRRAALAGAIERLDADPACEVAACSKVYETLPVGPQQPPYLNQAAALDTMLGPGELLKLLLVTEYALGRERGPERWGPRTIDLDLLLYDGTSLERPGLVVPHRRLLERSFVLVPLVELAPETVHPSTGRRLASHLADLRARPEWGWIRPHRDDLAPLDEMLVTERPAEAQQICQQWRATSRLGFVPTMGYLHQGHLSLVRQARAECDRVAVSIFVNPLQFGPGEDLARYPRDWARDRELCREAGVDLLLHAGPEQMYPADFSTYCVEEQLGRTLCGLHRPGHFRGVTTVVAKLFNLIAPHVAYFGRKDAQQAAIVERMARDLNFPIRIETLPIVREPDGLALSSRNAYLSAEERRLALRLSAGLRAAAAAFAAGERAAKSLIAGIERTLDPDGEALRVDYVAVVSRADFQPVETASTGDLIALAVFAGKTRLIDNLVLGEAE